MQIYLIRHPRPLIGTGFCYGRLDVDCEDPQPIAARLRPLLPPDTTIIASPLRRAWQLAQALDPAAQCDVRLCEMDFGEWEGQSWNEIDRHGLDAWATDILGYTPPGGESVGDLQRRVIDFSATLEGPHVALITHAGVIRALLGHWHQLPVVEWTQLQFEFGSLTEVSL